MTGFLAGAAVGAPAAPIAGTALRGMPAPQPDRRMTVADDLDEAERLFSAFVAAVAIRWFLIGGAAGLVAGWLAGRVS